MTEKKEKKSEFVLAVPAPKTFTSIRPDDSVSLLRSGTSEGVEPTFGASPIAGMLKIRELQAVYDKIVAGFRLPEFYLHGYPHGRGPMPSLVSLPGVEYVTGVYISRWEAGRLFWPVEVVPAKRVAEMENVLNYVSGLAGFGLPESEMHHTFEGNGFRVGVCRFKDVEEPWKLWEVDVGYVDPEEWVVMFVVFD